MQYQRIIYNGKRKIYIVAAFFIAFVPILTMAMTNQNYTIQSDSVNVGGLPENSANYNMDETIGETATGESSSESYRLKAGFQGMQEIYLSVSSPLDVVMNPAIGGISGGTGNGAAVWTVTTDNAAGYIMSVKAAASPSLQSGSNSFADYTPAGSPDFNWSVAGSDSEFGFTAESANLVQKFKDNGTACNAGTGDSVDKCWYNFSLSNETIVNSASAYPSGDAATVKFRAQSGASHFQAAGTYTATITVTVLAN